MTDLTVRGSLLEVQTQLSAISAIIKARKEGGWPIFQSDETWNYFNEEDDRVCPICEEYGHQKEFRGDEIPTTFPYYVYQPGDPFTVYPMTHMPDLSKFYDAPCRCWMIWVNPLECLEARLHLEKLEVSGVV